jgi:predicted metal-dependent peptidase
MVNKSDAEIFSEIGNRVTNLMISRQFYGLYLNMVNKELVVDYKKVPTAGVGIQNINYKLWINKMFWNGLKDKKQQACLLVHEALHIMLGHHKSRKNFHNHRRFNEAADLVINKMINDDHFFGKNLPGQHISKDDWMNQYGPVLEKLVADHTAGTMTDKEFVEKYYEIPMRGVFLEDYPELTSSDLEAGIAHVYDKLTKIEKAQPQTPQQGGQGGSGGEGDSDDKEDNPSSSKGSGGDANDDTGSSHDIVKKLKELGLTHMSDHMDWVEIEKLDPVQQKLMENQSKYIMKQVANEAKKSNGIGNLPNALKGIIDEILNPPKPIRNWKKETRDWLGGFGESTMVRRSFFKPNMIIPELPRIKLKHTKHIYLVMDTSGSVSPELMKQMCMIALNVKKTTDFKITVVECDAYVDPKKGVYELESISQINRRLQEGMVTGGGGTTVDPAIEYCNEVGDITGMMYLTDGHVYAPAKMPIYPFIMVKEDSKSGGASMESLQRMNWDCPVIEIPHDWGTGT